MKDKIFKKSKNKPEVLKGKIEGHSEGYAFFIPNDETVKDYFIHPNNLHGAIHGDIVEVTTSFFKGRKEAEVLNILEHKLKVIIGMLDLSYGKRSLLPLSKNYTESVKLKGELKGYKDSDVVVVDIVSYPIGKKRMEGVIKERLGSINDVGIDNKIVFYKYDIPKDFPDEVLASAKNISENKNIPIVDYSQLFTVTIDGDTAKDFDDAISVEFADGKYTLYVHIADVSRYVTMKSPMDKEATKRGTSIYFPEFAIPMLPENISNGVCSLLPNEERYTVTAKMVFDAKGNRLSKEFHRSKIISNFRLTYDYVNKMLAGEAKAITFELRAFLTLAKELSDNMQTDSRINFNMPSTEFAFEDGKVADIFPCVSGVSEKIIENFMIAANEAVAEHLEDNNIPTLFRTHAEPDYSSLKDWLVKVKELGLSMPKLPDVIESDYYNELLAMISSSNFYHLLSGTLLRTMMRAEYTSDNIGHFGLASKAYTHFTSPIRRYPDLIVHRALLGEENTNLIELARECSRLERFAAEAESEVTLYKKLFYLRGNFDKVFTAYVTATKTSQCSIFLEKLTMMASIDDFVPKSIKVGDILEVRLDYIDIFKLRAYFKITKDKKQKGK